MASLIGRKPHPLDQLATGESYFAPIGAMRSDGERVQCHVGGGWYRMIGGSHPLNAHGRTIAEYRNVFLLNVTASTVGPATSTRKRDGMREQITSGGRGYPLPKGGRPAPAA